MFVDDMIRIEEVFAYLGLFVSLHQSNLLDDKARISTLFPSSFIRSMTMIRRKFYLVVLLTGIFQIFFSTSQTQSTDEIISAVNVNQSKCEGASIDEFPPLFFNNEQRRRGGVLVHIALILYSFAAIEIVCDDYFASALEKISYNLNLTPVRGNE